MLRKLSEKMETISVNFLPSSDNFCLITLSKKTNKGFHRPGGSKFRLWQAKTQIRLLKEERRLKLGSIVRLRLISIVLVGWYVFLVLTLKSCDESFGINESRNLWFHFHRGTKSNSRQLFFKSMRVFLGTSSQIMTIRASRNLLKVNSFLVPKRNGSGYNLEQEQIIRATICESINIGFLIWTKFCIVLIERNKTFARATWNSARKWKNQCKFYTKFRRFLLIQMKKNLLKI